MRHKKNIFEQYIVSPITWLFKKRKYKKETANRRKKLFIKTNSNISKKNRQKQITIPWNVFKQKVPNNIDKKYLYLWSVLFAASILIILIFGPIFTIKNIQITKKDDITNMELSYNSIDEFRWISLFQINTEQIKEKLKNNQTNLKNVSLQILPPSTLKIQLESYNSAFNIILNEKNYILLANGSLVPHKPDTNLPNITIITKKSPGKFLAYKTIYNKNSLHRIMDTIKNLEENLISLQIENIIYYQTQRELHLLTQNNNRLIFDINEDTQKQVEKLAIFQTENNILNKNDILYTDLRIQNKIFFCTTKTEYICKKNLNYLYGE